MFEYKIEALNKIADEIEKETEALLDAGEIGMISDLTISFGGSTIRVPLTTPETNMQVIESLRDIANAMQLDF